MSRPPKVRPRSLTFGVFCMEKYSFEFKLKLVHDYLSGQGGLRFLAKKYGVKHNSQISKWINTYKKLCYR